MAADAIIHPVRMMVSTAAEGVCRWINEEVAAAAPLGDDSSGDTPTNASQPVDGLAC